MLCRKSKMLWFKIVAFVMGFIFTLSSMSLKNTYADKSTEATTKYIDLSLYDYSIWGTSNLNTTIQSLPGNDIDKLFFGNAAINYEVQNRWIGKGATQTEPKVEFGVVQGLAQEMLSDSGQLLFNFRTVDLFPTDKVAQGITVKGDYKFPLTYNASSGYYEFDSGTDQVFHDQYLELDGEKYLSLIESKTSLSGFWPLNKKSDTTKNEYFGAKFSTNFIMPEDGIVDGKHMIYEFSGDDDVFVYINQNNQPGKLVLDLGGIHGTMKGKIDFATGLITVDHVASVYDKQSKKFTPSNINKVGESNHWYLYSKSQYDSLTEADKEALGLKNIKIDHFVGLEYKQYETYDFTMFYLERGANLASCSMKLNVPIIQKHSVTVCKEVKNSSEDTSMYQFGLYVKEKGEEFKSKPQEIITVEGNGQGTFSTEVYEGQQYKIEEIVPQGSEYITEYRIGADGKKKDGTQTEDIKGSNSLPIIFTNTYPLESVKVTKDIFNKWSEKKGEMYQFELAVMNDTGIYQTIQTASLRAGETYTFENVIKHGQKYKIYEVVSSTLSQDIKKVEISNRNASSKVDTSKKRVIYESEAFTGNKKNEIVIKNTYKLGSILVHKSLVDEQGNEVADSLMDQTFLYQLTGTTNRGDKITLYEEIMIPKGSTKGSVTFQDVPLGTYTITEKNHMNYQQVEVVPEDTTISLTGAITTATVSFKNTKTNEYYYVDSHLLVNKGYYNEKTKMIEFRSSYGEGNSQN